ncbi:PCNA-associated factor, partial [Ophiophagus hannah]
VAARAPRKALGSGQANVSSSPTSRKAENKYAGGNPVCVRPTPSWQKGIGEFFRQTPNRREKENHNLEEEPGCKYVLCLLVLQNRKNLKMIKCELILDLQADLVLPEH